MWQVPLRGQEKLTEDLLMAPFTPAREGARPIAVGRVGPGEG